MSESKSSLAAGRHPLRGFTCGDRRFPRVRGLTRGYNPASPPGIEREHLTRTQLAKLAY